MNIEIVWRSFWALPALVLPGLFGHQAATPQPQRTPPAVHSPAATPNLSIRPTPKTAPQPSPSPAPTATAAPTAATAKQEIASEQTCPGQNDIAKTAAALTCLTAQARLYHGFTAVNANTKLMAAAAAKDQDMKSCGYGHTACGRAFNYWITAKGYSGKCVAENIAMGQKSPREVFIAWMSSAGHRANILNKDYHDIGVAELNSAKGPLWVMQLGGC